MSQDKISSLIKAGSYCKGKCFVGFYSEINCFGGFLSGKFQIGNVIVLFVFCALLLTRNRPLLTRIQHF
ncbi:hypothetical protein J2X14_001328 [Pantoea alhagi]|nr:hypothetical protein [Pantoea alhagi]